MTRSIVATTSAVGMVAMTRCPVSAALIAVSMVSASAISPITTTSGSCRSAARSPTTRLSVSTPTSRWVIEQLRSRWRNSIGFSMVTTCLCWVRLMWCTIAATVELFPLPLTPVTSTSPRSDSATWLRTSGRRSDSMVGTVNGNHPHHDHERGALAEDVHPEAAHARHAPGAVEVAQPLDPGAVLVAADQLHRDRPGLVRA